MLITSAFAWDNIANWTESGTTCTTTNNCNVANGANAVDMNNATYAYADSNGNKQRVEWSFNVNFNISPSSNATNLSEVQFTSYRDTLL